MKDDKPTSGLPLREGQWVALGLEDGQCPVGQIYAVDDGFIDLALFDVIAGYLSADRLAVRRSSIVEIMWAYSKYTDTARTRWTTYIDPLWEFQEAHHLRQRVSAPEPVDPAVVDLILGARDDEPDGDACYIDMREVPPPNARET